MCNVDHWILKEEEKKEKKILKIWMLRAGNIHILGNLEVLKRFLCCEVDLLSVILLVLTFVLSFVAGFREEESLNSNYENENDGDHGNAFLKPYIIYGIVYCS